MEIIYSIWRNVVGSKVRRQALLTVLMVIEEVSYHGGRQVCWQGEVRLGQQQNSTLEADVVNHLCGAGNCLRLNVCYCCLVARHV